MAAALIVIELAAPEVSAEELSVLVSSCTRAARGARCLLTGDAPSTSPSVVAIVTLQSDDKIRVEVGLRQGDHDSWRTKDFSFLANDKPLDRWRALGFAIGTLAENDPAKNPAQVNSDARTSGPPVDTPAPLPRAPSANAPRAARVVPGLRLFMGAKGVVGPGLSAGPWRVGGGVAAQLAPEQSPLFLSLAASASGRIVRDASGADVRWFDVSLGPGLAVLGSLSHSGLDFGVAVLLEHFSVSVRASNGDSGFQDRSLVGAEATLAGRVELTPGLQLSADLAASELSSETEVQVSGQSIGNAPRLRLLGGLGLRVQLP